MAVTYEQPDRSPDELIRADREAQRERDLAAGEALKLRARRQAERDVAEEELRTFRRAVLVSASEIIPQNAEWLWEERIPLGEITLIAGRGGVGKSTLLAWMVAKITNGKLKGAYYGQPRNVLYVANEDSFHRTVVPRFMAAGADLERVKLIRMESVVTGRMASLNLPLDCDILADSVRANEAVAVLMDPLSSNLKGVKNKNDSSSVREALEQIRQMAEDLNIAIPALAHLRKMSSSNLMDAISGSAEYGNVVRAAMGCVADPNDPGHYILSQEKNNLGRLDIPSWRYEIQSRDITYYKTGQQLRPVGKVKFIDQTDTKASDVLEDNMSGGRTSDAIEWLRDRLASGPVAAADLLKAAQPEGISRATLYRAADRLKIVKTRDGFQSPSKWGMPPP